MPQDNVHEIQLNGKQLVFMFMTATSAAVVIFLCGVMVGQRTNPPVEPDGVALAAGEDVDPTAVGLLEEPLAEVPIAEPEPFDPSFPQRLDSEEPIREPRPRTDVARTAQVEPPLPERREPVQAAAATEPPRVGAGSEAAAGGGYSVQVAAFGARGEADEVARRLSDKGFPSFVTAPEGSVKLFRVRVGTFGDRSEAEAMARRLEQEEQFRTWITR